jgi:hypothetical protein
MHLMGEGTVVTAAAFAVRKAARQLLATFWADDADLADVSAAAGANDPRLAVLVAQRHPRRLEGAAGVVGDESLLGPLSPSAATWEVVAAGGSAADSTGEELREAANAHTVLLRGCHDRRFLPRPKCSGEPVVETGVLPRLDLGAEPRAQKIDVNSNMPRVLPSAHLPDAFRKVGGLFG